MYENGYSDSYRYQYPSPNPYHPLESYLAKLQHSHLLGRPDSVDTENMARDDQKLFDHIQEDHRE